MTEVNQPFLSALDDAIAILEKTVVATALERSIGPTDPNVSDLRDLRRIRAKHTNKATLSRELPLQVAVVGTGATGDQVMQEIVRHIRVGGRKPSPERQKALSAARELLIGKKEPTKTSDLYRELVNKGVTIGGEIPVNNLSAMLSTSTSFQSHGRSGWTLRGEAMQ